MEPLSFSVEPSSKGFEPLYLYSEPLSGTLCCLEPGEPGARFPAAAPSHPEAWLEEPQALQAVGEKNELSIKMESIFGQPPTTNTSAAYTRQPTLLPDPPKAKAQTSKTLWKVETIEFESMTIPV